MIVGELRQRVEQYSLTPLFVLLLYSFFFILKVVTMELKELIEKIRDYIKENPKELWFVK
jgi:hypothetical protein